MEHLSFSTYAVFTSSDLKFSGNTSPVVFLKTPLSESEMQRIAADFWQPATTFLWQVDGEWQVRWYAPDAEIPLCGHGATAAVAALKMYGDDIILKREGFAIKGLSMDHFCGIQLNAFPVIKELEISTTLKKGLGIPIAAYFETAGKNIVLTNSEEDIKKMKPNFELLRSSNTFSYAVTSRGNQADFVSRTLVPHVHALEDSATGSSHAALVPFWANQLNKTEMVAHQLSKRGGLFKCSIYNQDVSIWGEYELIHQGKVLI